MADRIVILGAGTGGTLLANRLNRVLGDAVRITLVDRDDTHVYQPGLLFIPFGLAGPGDIVRPRLRTIDAGIELVLDDIDRVDPETDTVTLASGGTLTYDVLVVATGTRILPEETEGMTGPGWNERVFTFYDLDGATRLHEALRTFAGGRLVVNVVDMPIKCPVAPLEFCFLADWYLHERGVRDRTQITYATPLDAAFTKPAASAHLTGMLADKGIALETEFAAGEVDGAAGVLRSWDEREVPFDLLVTIPAHGGAAYVERSPGLGDDLGFVLTDPHTLQARVRPNVFAIGDATNVPTSKAGSVAHFEGETLARNIAHHLAGEPLEATFDGHANCFIETGFHKALLIDFDYDDEPLPGRYPHARVGPLPLLRDSRMNHLAKRMFQWVYWHMLLAGRDLPGISAEHRAPQGGRT